MSKIEIGRYSALLRRSFGMKGQETVAAELSPEISPTVQLEEASDPEWDFLKDVRNVSVAERVAANAAGAGQMLLTNPADSGVIAVIELLILSSPLIIDYTARLLVAPTPLLNTALTVATDTRWETTAVNTQSAILATFVNNLAIGVGAGTIWRHQLAVNLLHERKVGVVLTPGFGLAFGATTLNAAVYLSAHWHERHVPALEL